MDRPVQRGAGLDLHGIIGPARVFWNLSVPALYEEAIRRHEGLMAEGGPLVCKTGLHTGRSPKDRFFVREPSTGGDISWGAVNRPIEPDRFERLWRKVADSFHARDVFVRDCYVGADPAYRLPIRVITETAWHNLFARYMFIDEGDASVRARHRPAFTVIDAPSVRAIPSEHGTNSDVFILINFAERLILIGGSSYAGEIKKSIFTVMNYLLPSRNVMPMHCSANIGSGGDAALFFGLSGTGKTTLSSDPRRRLIGDDEHGWSEQGIFNFEGGCYAKAIRLSAEAEPQIYATTRQFGSLLENVAVDPESRQLDLDDDTLTENTRIAYPLAFIEKAVLAGVGPHPKNIVMLAADAFGVLPPIARLTPAGAMYHFLSGYTAKVAGTEQGVREPKATFSTCFGAPFMVWHPTVYAKLLGDRIARHNSRVWLVNTGWTGGPYGVGSRMKIVQTRAMIHAALSGLLDEVLYERDPVFNVEVPTSCPDVPAAVLRPRSTWKNPDDYDTQARRLAGMFADNFQAFEDAAEADVRAAGPRR